MVSLPYICGVYYCGDSDKFSGRNCINFGSPHSIPPKELSLDIVLMTILPFNRDDAIFSSFLTKDISLLYTRRNTRNKQAVMSGKGGKRGERRGRELWRGFKEFSFH